MTDRYLRPYSGKTNNIVTGFIVFSLAWYTTPNPNTYDFRINRAGTFKKANTGLDFRTSSAIQVCIRSHSPRTWLLLVFVYVESKYSASTEMLYPVLTCWAKSRQVSTKSIQGLITIPAYKLTVSLCCSLTLLMTAKLSLCRGCMEGTQKTRTRSWVSLYI